MKLSRRQKILVGLGIVGGAAAAIGIGINVLTAPQGPCPQPGDLVNDPAICTRCGLRAIPYPPTGQYMCER
jgi:hypothetical protein